MQHSATAATIITVWCVLQLFNVEPTLRLEWCVVVCGVCRWETSRLQGLPKNHQPDRCWSLGVSIIMVPRPTYRHQLFSRVHDRVLWGWLQIHMLLWRLGQRDRLLYPSSRYALGHAVSCLSLLHGFA